MTLLDPDRPDAPVDPARRPPRSLRPLLTRLHFYAGILVAPFIVVAAVSGALYAFTPQLERVVHDDQLFTDSRGELQSLDDQVAAARAVEPDLPLLAVRPAPEEGMTTRVLFDDGRTDASRRLAVFVDPVEGEVQGSLTAYGSSGSLPVRTWVDELHRSLHLGDAGRLYSELAASWLGVIALAGLALWWTGRRRTASRWRPDRGASGRRRTLSWHGAVGTWLVLGMLMLSATGLTWSRLAGANVTEVRAALSWTTPTILADLAQEESPDGHGGHGGHGATGEAADDTLPDGPGVGFQQAWEVAASQDLVGGVEITRPTTRSATYVVQEVDPGWPTQADAVSVDQAGRVVDVVRFDDYPLAAKLATWGIDLHMGTLFGVANQVALVLLAAGIVAMAAMGYRMWWQRRPTRGGRRLGRLARRGTWRQVHPGALVLVVAVALAVGWFVPLLGLSLLGFLVLDAVLGLRAGRATRAPGSPTPR